ncbi:hypothetical protein BS78_05G172600 [Paspalum vaginatum]|nr:hypothetical protein BS78_05G172600 [Paspalum vaginatum]
MLSRFLLTSFPHNYCIQVVEGADFLNKLFRNCVNQTLAEIVSVDVERFRVWRDFMAVHKIYLTCSSVLVVT